MIVFEPTASEGGCLARWTGGWIKTIEWTPEMYGNTGHSDRVLVLASDGFITIATFTPDAKYPWRTDQFDGVVGVTHWQPLPEPPKD